MKQIALKLPERLLELLDVLVTTKKDHYPNRSEAIRTFIRDGLIKERIWPGLMSEGDIWFSEEDRKKHEEWLKKQEAKHGYKLEGRK